MFSSSDPEVDRRVKAAKRGIRPEPLKQRLQEFIGRIWRLATREFEHLPDTPQFSPLRTDLLRLQKAKGIAADHVLREITELLSPLSPEQYDLLEWKALLADLKQEADSGRPLPFGYTPATVVADLDALNARIAHDPMVQRAWERRQQLWQSLKRNYMQAMRAIGVDVSDQLTQNILAKSTYQPTRDVAEGLPETVVASGLLSAPETMVAAKSIATGPAKVAIPEEDREREQKAKESREAAVSPPSPLPPDLGPVPPPIKERPPKIGDRINREIQKMAEQFPSAFDIQTGPPRLYKRRIEPTAAEPLPPRPQLALPAPIEPTPIPPSAPIIEQPAEERAGPLVAPIEPEPIPVQEPPTQPQILAEPAPVMTVEPPALSPPTSPPPITQVREEVIEDEALSEPSRELPPGLVEAPGIPAPPQLAMSSLAEDVEAERTEAVTPEIVQPATQAPPPLSRETYKGIPLDKPVKDLTDEEMAILSEPDSSFMSERNRELAKYEKDPRFYSWPKPGDPQYAPDIPEHEQQPYFDPYAVREYLQSGRLVSDYGQRIQEIADLYPPEEFSESIRLLNARNLLDVLLGRGYNDVLDLPNKTSRDIFERLTGITLPETRSETQAAIQKRPIPYTRPTQAEQPLPNQPPAQPPRPAEPSTPVTTIPQLEAPPHEVRGREEQQPPAERPAKPVPLTEEAAPAPPPPALEPPAELSQLQALADEVQELKNRVADLEPPSPQEVPNELQRTRMEDTRPSSEEQAQDVPVSQEPGTSRETRTRPATTGGRDANHPRTPRVGAARSDGDDTGSDLSADRGGHADTGRGEETVESIAEDHLLRGQDFVLGEDFEIPSGQKAKFSANVEAIKLLKTIEHEGRLATPEEQKILARYTGWGGLPQVYDRLWSKEREILRKLLTEQEYNDARASTPNAHYTDPKTIHAIYRGLEHLGFTGGRLLEPAAGIGHFLGAMPPAITNRSQRVAIEKDSLSARIAKLLYPHASVQNSEYQKVVIPDSFFDVAVGNVPFADVRVFDPHNKELSRMNMSLHDYFFAKALTQVRPGGLVVFITSRYTMDKQDTKVRAYLANHANLIGAIRLPRTQFKEIANTEVVTDIIVLQRREEGIPASGETWESSTSTQIDNKPVSINEYYLRHPEQVLGRLSMSGSMYRANELTVEPDGRDMGPAIDDAFRRMPAGVLRPRLKPTSVTTQGLLDALPAENDILEGSYVLRDSGLHVKHGGELVPVPDISQSNLERAKGLIGLRNQIREVLHTQLENAPDNDVAAAIRELNKRYDQFVKKFGPVNSRANKSILRGDPEYANVQALEKRYDPKSNTAQKADIFTERVVKPRRGTPKIETAKDALLFVLNERGTIDWARIEQVTGRSQDELKTELYGLVFQDPSGEWVVAEKYLSGDVRMKLKLAKSAAEIDPLFKRNVEALQAVIPPDIPHDQIAVKLGVDWIPTTTYAKFISEIFDIRLYYVNVSYNATVGAYDIVIQKQAGLDRNAKNLNVYGTPDYPAIDLIIDAMDSRLPTIYTKTTDGSRIMDKQKTIAAREKQARLQEKFVEWLWSDETRKSELTQLYNETRRNFRKPTFDGSHLELQGSNPEITLRQHQKNVVWRALINGNTLIA
ncbi:MAG: hypothetical protein LDL14_02790 [Nitrospira sp.]|nr:hypothetical protein [Nitrospira sp.]